MKKLIPTCSWLEIVLGWTIIRMVCRMGMTLCKGEKGGEERVRRRGATVRKVGFAQDCGCL